MLESVMVENLSASARCVACAAFEMLAGAGDDV